MKTTPQGIDFIKQFEGFRTMPYQDIAGLWTVGYGHLMKPGDGTVVGSPITMGQATALLAKDLSTAETAVNNCGVSLTQNEFDALVSFTYNCGVGAFNMSSTKKDLIAGNKQKAADEMLLWNKAKDPKTGQLVVSQGLDRRRHAERELFLKE